MKIRFLKNHGPHKQGDESDEGAAAATYLIRVGVAEEVKHVDPIVQYFIKQNREYAEKMEVKQPEFKEKQENKTGNVPTAKKRKK